MAIKLFFSFFFLFLLKQPQCARKEAKKHQAAAEQTNASEQKKRKKSECILKQGHLISLWNQLGDNGRSVDQQISSSIDTGHNTAPEVLNVTSLPNDINPMLVTVFFINCF